MKIKKVQTTPFKDQHPGTSGLRKKTRQIIQPHYVENFVQSVLNTIRESHKEQDNGYNSLAYLNAPLIIGGDGRYFNREAIHTIVKIALANQFKHVCVAKNGLLSTPAASAVIREKKANGAFILSASHNAGGIDEDFGIKYNLENGEPAPEKFTERVFENSKHIVEYSITDIPELDFDSVHVQQFDNGAKLEVFDGLDCYVNLMQKIFDFDALRNLFKNGFKMRFDAMHAITGPYAKRIFEELLGADAGSVVNGIPLEDFGGGHPDPNKVHAKNLVDFMYSGEAPHFAAASDGDGDRNMILGKNCFVTPCDSLAIISLYAKDCIPAYKAGLSGIARSMPTSLAADNVASKLNIPIFETPTGWKYFVNLMEAGKCTICGEESFGTGSNHIREKDGIWAVLCWLSIIAFKQQTSDKNNSGAVNACQTQSEQQTSESEKPKHECCTFSRIITSFKKCLTGTKDDSLSPADTGTATNWVSVKDIVEDFWKQLGRNYYQRHDHENLDGEKAQQFIDNFRNSLSSLSGQTLGKYTIVKADDFSYTDPVDGSVASRQGFRLFLNGQDNDGDAKRSKSKSKKSSGRVVFRLSGTGSSGAILRIYYEIHEKTNTSGTEEQILKGIISDTRKLLKLKETFGKDEPEVIT